MEASPASSSSSPGHPLYRNNTRLSRRGRKPIQQPALTPQAVRTYVHTDRGEDNMRREHFFWVLRNERRERYDGWGLLVRCGVRSSSDAWCCRSGASNRVSGISSE